MVRSPLVGAVQLHQADLPPGLPAWLGSPVSLLAFPFEPEPVRLVPVRTIRLLNLSFGTGGANNVTGAPKRATPTVATSQVSFMDKSSRAQTDPEFAEIAPG